MFLILNSFILAIIADMKITSFYGISSSANCSGAEDSDGGLTSTIKSRRLAAARAAEERIKKERDDKLR